MVWEYPSAAMVAMIARGGFPDVLPPRISPPELGGDLVGDDQVWPGALGLGPQVFGGGAAYLASGAFLAKVKSEHFSVHVRLDGDQYAEYYRRHERGPPFSTGTRSMPMEAHRDRSRLCRAFFISQITYTCGAQEMEAKPLRVS
jgi:hypothetical protein